MSTVHPTQPKIAPAGSNSPTATVSASTTKSPSTDEVTPATPNAMQPTPTRMLMPTAFFIPNADGSTALAHLVPVTQATDGVQSIFIKPLVTSKNSTMGGNNLMGMLTTSPMSTLGNCFFF